MKVKNYDSFFNIALLLFGDIQLNAGPNSDVRFVSNRILKKISFYCIKCDLRATRCFLIAIYVVTVKDERIYFLY